ncbi:MAG: PAS domain S-box protein [Myxococcales bacterium]|nr:PAS domain S-box protein [Myxococcales bacterium]
MLKTVRVPPPFEALFEPAQEYVSRFFAERRDVPEQARIEVFGQRYMLVRARAMSVEFFEMIQRLYKDKGEAEALGVARSLLFDIAHAMGLSDARDFAERMDLKDPIAKLSAGPIHFAHAGWAFVDISPDSRPSPDENFYLLYDHPYSFECDSWLGEGKRTEFPVCVMNAGYSSGWCEASFDVPLVSTEILCRAKGDEHCRFIMAHPTRIEGYIQDYLKAQPPTSAHATRYEIPGFFSRKKQEDELRSREEQYRGIFEAGTNGLFILRDDGVIVQANPAASRLFRLDLAEFPGRGIDSLVQLHTGAGDDFFRRFSAQIAAEGSYYDEALGIVRTGERCHVEIRGSRFRFENREHLLAIVNDITEQKLAQLALRAAHDELERRVRDRTAELEKVNLQLSLLNEKLVSARDHAIDASRAKSAFLANMSHELRTPLNAIIGYSELIEEESQEDEPAISLVDVAKIRSAARHLLALIDDILDVSKIEAGKMEVFAESFDARELIDEVVATIEPLAARNNNRLVLDLGTPLGQLHTDRTKLKQIALNLLSNACKFTHAGTVRLTVRRTRNQPRLPGGELSNRPSTPELSGDWLTLEVKDSGIGIPTDRLEELFQPFRQADESTTRKYGGTGLGLSISRHYCQMMQGTIHADSAPGRGSTFTVRLPVLLAQATPRPGTTPGKSLRAQ